MNLAIPLSALQAVLVPETHLAATAPGYVESLDRLLAAIAEVESGGDRWAAHREADGSLACGLYQIRPVYLADANRLVRQYRLPVPPHPKTGVPRDGYAKPAVYDPDAARRIVCLVLAHYAVHWIQAGHGRRRGVGDAVPAEILARIHNGGYQGLVEHPDRTDAYRAKVRTALAAQAAEDAEDTR